MEGPSKLPVLNQDGSQRSLGNDSPASSSRPSQDAMFMRTYTSPPAPLDAIDKGKGNADLQHQQPPPLLPAANIENGRPQSSEHSVKWRDSIDTPGPLVTRDSGADSDMSGAENSRRTSESAPIGNRRRWAMVPSLITSDGESEDDEDTGAESENIKTSGRRGRKVRKSRIDRKSLDYSTGDETETQKRTSIFTKMKNSAKSFGHGRSFSGWAYESGDETPNGPLTPTALQPYAATTGDEDSAAEYIDTPRRSYSPDASGSRTAPSTPSSSKGHQLPRIPRRRATMTDIPEEARDALRSADKSGRRPTSFRRFTNFASRDSGVEPQSPGGTGATAGRWKAIKAGLKMIGQGKKEKVSKIDIEKSAELLAELSAGTPAVMILATMFQRDEHGNRRIPILLEQLKLKIIESEITSRSHRVLTIQLEYGSGLTRMRWVIHREWSDFVKLHVRYKTSEFTKSGFGGKRARELPKFPTDTIPYLRGVRGEGGSSSDEEDADAESGAEGAVVPKKKKGFFRRNSTSNSEAVVDSHDLRTGIAAGLGTLTGAVGGVTPLARKDPFAVRQRQKLEEYLKQLIRIMIFRPDANRLCKFLEISALGIRLAAEGSYHGKEGYMVIRSAKGSDFKRVWSPRSLARRHAPKWFLVRHSYIVCVDSPEEMNIYDVFLVDSEFSAEPKKFLRTNPKDLSVAPSNPAHPQHHGLTIKNQERQVKLLCKNERQLSQWVDSMRYMQANTPWSQKHRFDSFAPVRKNVFCQWLVDGRDYMWNVSRAINMAKDVIYIHDWWLSPELYLRRPAAISQKWRIDRLLQKKAAEGVKVFIIVYRNIGAAIPIDSAYTKYSLLDLSPNIFVQRSPNQLRQNTFFWAHHEKILVVDHMVAFVGGIDLCFGRWDTPQHSLIDDKITGFEEGTHGRDPDEYQLWPGKDYSNPRMQDFYELDKPYEDMYDRSRIPRTPWHDVAMQVVGQPARDLTRHFVQRWNYLLRQRKPSRPTPVLLPPPDFTPLELESLGINGTCELQMIRSSSAWSTGTPDTIEKSILNAYLKAIETSDHFVYIENQFFITSCEFAGTKIENSIGDALVERIVRAYRNDEEWRAIILIPLMPGFQNTVDSPDGSSVRIIMELQYQSICRGSGSIFSRLKAQGIEPEDYIQFYGLRNWGEIGPEKALVTEQVYIHAKVMVVDDRIAIIGSANINDRSMAGNRDSEVGVIVRDTDTIMSTMAGRPYRVGKFPHTLRMRLMREHLGIDVDALMAEEQQMMDPDDADWEAHVKRWQHEQGTNFTTGNLDYNTDEEGSIDRPSRPPTDAPSIRSPSSVRTASLHQYDAVFRDEVLYSFNHDVDWEQEDNPNIQSKKKPTTDSRVTGSPGRQKDVDGKGYDNMANLEALRERLIEKGKKVLTPRMEKPPKWPSSNKGSKGRSEKEDEDNSDPELPPGLQRDLESGYLRPQSADNRSRRPSDVSSNRPKSKASNLSRVDTVHSRIDAPIPPTPGLNDTPVIHPYQLPPLPRSNDFDIGGGGCCRPMSHGSSVNPTVADYDLSDMQIPEFDAECFRDPLDDDFFLDIWHRCAINNTNIYRQVFRCMPDNEVKTWREYKQYTAYSDKFAKSMSPEKPASSGDNTTGAKGGQKKDANGNGEKPPSTPLPANDNNTQSEISEKESISEQVPSSNANPPHDQFALSKSLSQDQSTRTNSEVTLAEDPDLTPRPLTSQETPNPMNSTKPISRGSAFSQSETASPPTSRDGFRSPPPTGTSTSNPPFGPLNGASIATSGTRRKRRGTRTSRREFVAANTEVMGRDEAAALLSMVRGHLVVWPYEWLASEAESGTWLFSIDQLAPVELYD